MPISFRRALWAASLVLILLGAACLKVKAETVPLTTLPIPLTLRDAVRIALANQPQQAVANAQVRVESGFQAEAQSQYFPTVTPQYTYENARQTQYGLGSQTVLLPSGGSFQLSRDQVIESRGGTASVALNQMLFDTGNRELLNAQARRNLAAAGYGAVNTRQQIVSAVTQDFYALLASMDLVKVAQANVDRYRQSLQFTQGQASAGTIAAIQVLQAQADLSNAQVALLQNQASVESASATLKNAMGIVSDAPVQPAQLTSGQALPPLPAASAQSMLEQYYQSALAHRPDLRQQEQTVEGQRIAVKQARLNTGLTASGTYALEYTPINEANRVKSTDSRFIITLSAPLFDAGNSRAALHVAEAQRDIALAQLDTVRQNVRLDVEHAYTLRQAYYASAQLAQTAVQAALQNYNAAVASREAGVDTLLDVITAQATLTSAEDQYIAAIYNYYIADSNLQKATGQNL